MSRFFFCRTVALFLTLALSLPNPALALRPEGLEEGKPAAKQELRRALGVPTPGLEEPKPAVVTLEPISRYPKVSQDPDVRKDVGVEGGKQLYDAYIRWLNENQLRPPSERELFDWVRAAYPISNDDLLVALHQAEDRSAHSPIPVIVLPQRNPRLATFLASWLAYRAGGSVVPGVVPLPSDWSWEQVASLIEEEPILNGLSQDTALLAMVSFVSKTRQDLQRRNSSVPLCLLVKVGSFPGVGTDVLYEVLSHIPPLTGAYVKTMLQAYGTLLNERQGVPPTTVELKDRSGLSTEQLDGAVSQAQQVGRSYGTVPVLVRPDGLDPSSDAARCLSAYMIRRVHPTWWSQRGSEIPFPAEGWDLARMGQAVEEARSLLAPMAAADPEGIGALLERIDRTVEAFAPPTRPRFTEQQRALILAYQQGMRHPLVENPLPTIRSLSEAPGWSENRVRTTMQAMRVQLSGRRAAVFLPSPPRGEKSRARFVELLTEWLQAYNEDHPTATITILPGRLAQAYWVFVRLSDPSARWPVRWEALAGDIGTTAAVDTPQVRLAALNELFQYLFAMPLAEMTPGKDALLPRLAGPVVPAAPEQGPLERALRAQFDEFNLQGPEDWDAFAAMVRVPLIESGVLLPGQSLPQHVLEQLQQILQSKLSVAHTEQPRGEVPGLEEEGVRRETRSIVGAGAKRLPQKVQTFLGALTEAEWNALVDDPAAAIAGYKKAGTLRGGDPAKLRAAVMAARKEARTRVQARQQASPTPAGRTPTGGPTGGLLFPVPPGPRLVLRLAPDGNVQFVQEQGPLTVPGKNIQLQMPPPPEALNPAPALRADLDRLQAMLVDAYRSVAAGGAATVNVQPIKVHILRTIQRTFQTSAPDVMSREWMVSFLRELGWKFFLPVGDDFSVVPLPNGGVSPLLLRITSRWGNRPYLEGRGRVWFARAAHITGPLVLGIAGADIALVDLDASRAHTEAWYQALMAVQNPGNLTAHLRQRMSALYTQDPEEFRTTFGASYSETEEFRHAQDMLWACHFFGQNLRLHNWLTMLTVEAILRPGSLIDQTIWTPDKRRQVFTNPHAIVELAGQLGAVAELMGAMLEDGADDWAYGIFLRFLNEKVDEIQGLAAIPGMGYEGSVARQVFDFFARARFANTDQLIAYLNATSPEQPQPAPGLRAFELINRFYLENFFTDDERLALLTGLEEKITAARIERTLSDLKATLSQRKQQQPRTGGKTRDVQQMEELIERLPTYLPILESIPSADSQRDEEILARIKMDLLQAGELLGKKPRGPRRAGLEEAVSVVDWEWSKLPVDRLGGPAQDGHQVPPSGVLIRHPLLNELIPDLRILIPHRTVSVQADPRSITLISGGDRLGTYEFPAVGMLEIPLEVDPQNRFTLKLNEAGDLQIVPAPGADVFLPVQQLEAMSRSVPAQVEQLEPVMRSVESAFERVLAAVQPIFRATVSELRADMGKLRTYLEVQTWRARAAELGQKILRLGEPGSLESPNGAYAGPLLTVEPVVRGLLARKAIGRITVNGQEVTMKQQPVDTFIEIGNLLRVQGVLTAYFDRVGGTLRITSVAGLAGLEEGVVARGQIRGVGTAQFPVTVYQTPADIGRAQADQLIPRWIEAAKANRPFVVGLATGSTPEPLLAEIARRLPEMPAELRQQMVSSLHIVAMDDIVDPATGTNVPPDHPRSAVRFFRERLFDRVPEMTPEWSAGHLIVPTVGQVTAQVARVQSLGGVRWQLMATDPNEGHVAEVAAGELLGDPAIRAVKDRPRIFSPLFLQHNAWATGFLGITLTLDDFVEMMAPDGVVSFAAFGAAKAGIARRFCEDGRYNADRPITFLWMHPMCDRTAVLLDEASAAQVIGTITRGVGPLTSAVRGTLNELLAEAPAGRMQLLAGRLPVMTPDERIQFLIALVWVANHPEIRQMLLDVFLAPIPEAKQVRELILETVRQDSSGQAARSIRSVCSGLTSSQLRPLIEALDQRLHAGTGWQPGWEQAGPYLLMCVQETFLAAQLQNYRTQSSLPEAQLYEWLGEVYAAQAGHYPVPVSRPAVSTDVESALAAQCYMTQGELLRLLARSPARNYPQLAARADLMRGMTVPAVQQNYEQARTSLDKILAAAENRLLECQALERLVRLEQFHADYLAASQQGAEAISALVRALELERRLAHLRVDQARVLGLQAGLEELPREFLSRERDLVERINLEGNFRVILSSGGLVDQIYGADGELTYVGSPDFPSVLLFGNERLLLMMDVQRGSLFQLPSRAGAPGISFILPGPNSLVEQAGLSVLVRDLLVSIAQGRGVTGFLKTQTPGLQGTLTMNLGDGTALRILRNGNREWVVSHLPASGVVGLEEVRPVAQFTHMVNSSEQEGGVVQIPVAENGVVLLELIRSEEGVMLLSRFLVRREAAGIAVLNEGYFTFSEAEASPARVRLDSESWDSADRSPDPSLGTELPSSKGIKVFPSPEGLQISSGISSLPMRVYPVGPPSATGPVQKTPEGLEEGEQLFEQGIRAGPVRFVNGRAEVAGRTVSVGDLPEFAKQLADLQERGFFRPDGQTIVVRVDPAAELPYSTKLFDQVGIPFLAIPAGTIRIPLSEEIGQAQVTLLQGGLADQDVVFFRTGLVTPEGVRSLLPANVQPSVVLADDAQLRDLKLDAQPVSEARARITAIVRAAGDQPGKILVFEVITIQDYKGQRLLLISA